MSNVSSIYSFKLLGRLVLLIAGLLLTLILLDRLTTRQLLKNINFKTAYITNHPVQADIVFHGPCEPEWMIDPKIIGDSTGHATYNLALNHSDFADNYLHLYLYLKHQKAPKYFFLYASPVSFDKKLSNTFNTYRFAPFLGDKEVYNTVRELDPKYARFSSIPFLRYAYYSDFTYLKALQGSYYSATNRQQVEHPDGYAPALSWWNTAITHYTENALDKKQMDWYPEREKYFRKTIELAQRYGCKVYVYESPIYRPDEEYISNRVVMLSKIKAITDSYRVPFLVFDTLAMASDKQNFWSTYNTTYKGSCEFSKIIGQYIREQIIQKSTNEDLQRN